MDSARSKLSRAPTKSARKYRVWKRKQLFGHWYMGVERTTFIIGPDGRIVHVFPKVNPEGHAEEVAARLKVGL